MRQRDRFGWHAIQQVGQADAADGLGEQLSRAGRSVGQAGRARQVSGGTRTSILDSPFGELKLEPPDTYSIDLRQMNAN